MNRAIITAAEAVCALGGDLASCLESWGHGRTGLTFQDGLLAGRIEDRALLKGRRYGAASNLAVHVAKRAVTRAGWSAEHTREAWIYAASSRGNAGELLGANAWRRPLRRFSASNTLHSEIAASISIELGVKGPWNMISNGCSSSLDALGHAWMALRSGLARRVIVVAVDLPLVPEILRDFKDTGLLARDAICASRDSGNSGFHPGEAAVALTLENEGEGCEIESYLANSDAFNALAMPESGQPLADLLGYLPRPDYICPHATGTPGCATSEWNAFSKAYGLEIPPRILLKPYTGHTLGASGLLELALVRGAMMQGFIPSNLGQPITNELLYSSSTGKFRFLKIAASMGGHNSVVMISR